MTYVDTKRTIRAVEEGTAHKLPSWSRKDGEVHIFFECVRRMAEKDGVSAKYIHFLYSTPEATQILLLAAGDMEAAGRSFMQQQIGASELLLEMWRRYPETSKRNLDTVEI